MKEWKGNYVCHVCKKCGCAFVAEDYTNAQDMPPKWRYCPDCAKEKGIDYEKQTPKSNRTPEENERYKKLGERGAENLKKFLERNKSDKDFTPSEV